MVEAGYGAGWPSESPFGMTKIAHDVPVFPATLLGSWTAQVGRRRAAVMHGSQAVKKDRYRKGISSGSSSLQMPDFVSRYDDAAEAAGVFNDGDGVDLLQSLVDDASSSDVRESWTGQMCYDREFRPRGVQKIHPVYFMGKSWRFVILKSTQPPVLPSPWFHHRNSHKTQAIVLPRTLQA